MHVADGVDMHHQRNEGDDQHHHRSQRVDQETDLESQIAQCHPGVDSAIEGVAGEHILKHHHRGDKGHSNARNGDDMRAGATDETAEQACNNGAEQRRQRHDEIERLHVHPHQPFRWSRSSTLIVRIFRNSTTRIARPMADSAAATVRMKKTKIWPWISPR